MTRPLIHKTNLFADIPAKLTAEWVQTLWENPHLKIERIVSRGHGSPQGLWYDQDWDEWVVLLKGSAGLLFDGEEQITTLAPGDALLIPSGVKHRVVWTDEHVETLWLAVHAYGEQGASSNIEA